MLTTTFNEWEERDRKRNKDKVPLFNVPKEYSTRKIKIANGSLSDSDTKIIEITCNEVGEYLAKNYGQDPFDWQETVSGPTALKKLSASQLPLKAISDFYESPYSNAFALCYLGEKVGFGLFATMDIPDNTTIGIYAGELKQTYREGNPVTSEN